MEEQIETIEQVSQDPPSRKLYEGLVSEKLYTKSFEEFQKQFSTSDAISKLHKGLNEEGLYTKGVNDFTAQYFSTLKKKEPSVSSNGISKSPYLKEAKDIFSIDSFSEFHKPEVIVPKVKRTVVENTTDSPIGTAIVKGLASVASSTLKSIGIAAKQLDFFNEYEGKKAEDLATYKAGQWIDDKVKDLAGELSPEDQDRFAVKLAQGAGQMGGFVLGGLGGKVLKIAPFLTTAGLGAATAGAGEYEAAINAGATDEQAAKAFWLNSLIGTTEALPIMGAFRKLDKYTGGLATGALAKRLSSTVGGRITNEVAQGIFTEASQEAVSQAMSNVVASKTYDAARNIYDGLLESAAIGGIIGGSMNGIVSVIRERRAMGGLTKEEDNQLAITQKFAEEKAAEAFNPDKNEVTTNTSKNKKVKEIVKAKTDIEADLASANLPQETQAIMQDEVAALDTQLEDAKSEAYQQELDNETATVIQSEIDKNEALLTDNNLSEGTKTVIQKQIDANKEKLAQIKPNEEETTQLPFTKEEGSVTDESLNKVEQPTEENAKSEQVGEVPGVSPSSKGNEDVKENNVSHIVKPIVKEDLNKEETEFYYRGENGKFEKGTIKSVSNYDGELFASATDANGKTFPIGSLKEKSGGILSDTKRVEEVYREAFKDAEEYGKKGMNFSLVEQTLRTGDVIPSKDVLTELRNIYDKAKSEKSTPSPTVTKEKSKGNEDVEDKKKTLIEQKNKELTGVSPIPQNPSKIKELVSQIQGTQREVVESIIKGQMNDLGWWAEDIFIRTGVPNWKELAIEQKKDVQYNKDKGGYELIRQNKIDKINADYEAKLDALRATKPENPPTVEQVNKTENKTKDEGTFEEAAKKLADKVRSGKINKLGGFKTSTGFDAVWDASLEVVAKTLETTGKIADAIEAGLNHIKKSDWYKGLTDKKDFEDKYRNHLNKEFGEPEKKSSITVIQPKDNKPPNVVVNSVAPEIEGDAVGITHADTGERRIELGLDGYEKIQESLPEWNAKADERIKNGEMPDLIKKLENGGGLADGVEQTMLGKHIANLNAEVRKNPSNKNINELERAMELNEIAGTRQFGQVGRARQERFMPDETLGKWLVEKKASKGVDELTEKQKEEVTKKFEEYEAANKAVEEKMAKMAEEISKLKAENALKTEHQKRTNVRAKNREALETERKEIITSIKDKLKKSREETTSVTIPYAKDLIAIAPDVAKLVRNLVETGTSKLADIVDTVHETLKDEIKGITKKDVNDLIAGEYNKKPQTKSALQLQLKEVKDEAALITKLEKLESLEPKTEKQTQQRNKNITDLRKQIKDFKTENPDYDGQLKSIKTRNTNQFKQIVKDLRDKNFTTKPIKKFDWEAAQKKANPKLWKETMDAIAKREEAKRIWDLEKHRDELRKKLNVSDAEGVIAKSKAIGRNVLHYGAKGIATTKAIKAGIDDSITFIQLGLAIMRNPRAGVKAKWQAIQDINNTRFKRQLTALHQSPRWELIKESGLDITEPRSLHENMIEELYSENLLDQDFIVKGKRINLWTYTGGIFERLFTSMGNNMRLNLFLKRVEQLENSGMTFESHPQEFKDAARVVNELTSRGKTHELVQNINPIVTPIIWAPKMLASSLNLLGISDIALGIRGKGFYQNLTPKQRNFALQQVGGGIGMGIAIMVILGLRGWDVDYEPESTTFGTVGHGTTRYNVFGRFSGVVKVIVQAIMGKRKTKFGEQDLDNPKYGGKTRWGLLGSFGRGKMTPIAGEVYDLTFNNQENFFTHEPITAGSLPSDLLTPISIADMKKGLDQDGSLSLLTRFLPAFEGINVTDERDFIKESVFTKEELQEPVFKPFVDSGLQMPNTLLGNETITDEKNKTKKKISDYPTEVQDKYKEEHKKALKEELLSIKKVYVKYYTDTKGERVSAVSVEEPEEGISKKIAVSDLSLKEKMQVLRLAQSAATRSAKSKVFYKKSKL